MNKKLADIALNIIMIAILIAVALAMFGCKTVNVKENVNVRDSVVYNYKDSIRWHYRDSVVTIYNRVTVQDSSGLVIQFGEGGGTYNAKTGEATNVTGVQQSDTHNEQRDSTAHYRQQAAEYQQSCDSLTSQLTALQSEYEQQEKRLRTGYDKFCSTWFWITAILLLLKVACWVCEKIPTTAPYAVMIRRYVPFL